MDHEGNTVNDNDNQLSSVSDNDNQAEPAQIAAPEPVLTTPAPRVLTARLSWTSTSCAPEPVLTTPAPEC